jgi:hypothetical protein
MTEKLVIWRATFGPFFPIRVRAIELQLAGLETGKSVLLVTEFPRLKFLNV